jgi:gas vesicle structural protein
MMLGIGQTPDTPDERQELQRVSLCEALDRILNKGAVVSGELTIAVANVDLLYLSLQLVLTSVETARRELILV